MARFCRSNVEEKRGSSPSRSRKRLAVRHDGLFLSLPLVGTILAEKASKAYPPN